MDCAGLCVLGDGFCRGAAPGERCPEGYACIDDRTTTASKGPRPMPVVCRPAAPNECVADAGCAAKDEPCTFCPDGSLHCAKVGCVNGACTAELVPCGVQTSCAGITGATCLPGFECVDDPNDMCTPDNGADCPGTCQPATGGECTSDEECPPLRAPCSVCADGEALCPKTFCDGGRCVAEYPSCPQPPGCVSDADCGSGQTCVLPPDGMCDPCHRRAGLWRALRARDRPAPMWRRRRRHVPTGLRMFWRCRRGPASRTRMAAARESACRMCRRRATPPTTASAPNPARPVRTARRRASRRSA